MKQLQMNKYMSSLRTVFEDGSPGLRFLPRFISSDGGLLSAPNPNPLDLGMYSMGSARLSKSKKI